MAAREEGDEGWAALPEALLHALLALLPLDARACAACVCRPWRAATAQRMYWQHVDFGAMGDARSRVDVDAATLARVCSAARCGGVLETLDASTLLDACPDAVATEMLRLHGATLRELRLPGQQTLFRAPSLDSLRTLAATAPALRALHAPCAVKTFAEAVEALEAPPPLRVSALQVWLPSMGGFEQGSSHGFVDALRRHTLPRLSLVNADVYDATAFAEALGAAGVRRLELREALLADADANGNPLNAGHPGTRGRCLARILNAAALTHLYLKQTVITTRSRTSYLCGANVAALAPALRGAGSLRVLHLDDCLVFRDTAAAVALLTACTAHPSLRTLNVMESRNSTKESLSDARDARLVGDALAALVSTPGSRLRTLLLLFCYLGDGVLGPLVDALPSAPRLRRLTLYENALSREFVATRLLPAARAAPRLLQLQALEDRDWERDKAPEAAEVEELVNKRNRRDAYPFRPEADDDMPTDEEDCFDF